jgi:hypothetical protein
MSRCFKYFGPIISVFYIFIQEVHIRRKSIIIVNKLYNVSAVLGAETVFKGCTFKNKGFIELVP